MNTALKHRGADAFIGASPNADIVSWPKRSVRLLQLEMAFGVCLKVFFPDANCFTKGPRTCQYGDCRDHGRQGPTFEQV